MRKILLLIGFAMSIHLIHGQTATLKIDTVYDNGGTILVPITLEAISNPITGNNLISSWGWYIAYDASVLNAGLPGGPATLINLNSQFPSENYLTNIIADNPSPGWNTIAIVYSSAVSGMGSAGMKFFDIQFAYVGSPEGSDIYWTSTNKAIKSPKFVTNMTDDAGNEFTLTLINGNVSPRITATLKIGTVYDNGVTVDLPVTLDTIENPLTGNNLISSWGWYISYDASVLNAGVTGGPATLINLSSEFPADNYLTNIIAENPTPGWNTIAIIYSSAVSGIANPGDKFFDIHFNYIGFPTSSNIIWTSTNEIIKSPKFVTNMADDEGNEFFLTLINGSVLPTPGPTLNLKVFLEGPYYSGQMTPFLNVLGHLPTNQPYNIAPWNYSGTESVTSFPSSDIVDWVLVDVLKPHTDGNQIRFEVMERKAGFLFKDGFIKDIDGTSNLTVETIMTSGFYIRIHHRNHLSVISAMPLVESDGVFSYDFTLSADQALGGSLSQKQLSSIIWGMIAADANASGQIDNRDKNEVWLPQQGLTGYYEGDFNMDTQVDNDDKIVKWEPNAGKSSYPIKDTITTAGTWICGQPFIDERDDQNYNTVQIGDQCWMAENLKIGIKIDGTEEMSNNSQIEKYCYNNDVNNCNTYGGLYQWNEMMNYTTSSGAQGICPDGWHIPKDEELTTLFTSLGGTDVAGGKMKSTGTIEAGTGLWHTPNTGATNESGFSSIPGGYRFYNGTFLTFGYGVTYWSSSEVESDSAFVKLLAYNVAKVWEFSDVKNEGYSVRCLKNTPSNWSCGDVLIDNRDNQNYNTVQIGEQCWMAENINVGIQASQANNGIIEKYCYNNDPANCDIYGGLYNWYEMMKYIPQEGSQGICPNGWNIPSKGEWETLINHLGGVDIAGGKLKEEGTAHWYPPNTGATNESGFSAIPGGTGGGSYYVGIGTSCYLWSSTDVTLYHPYYIQMSNQHGYIVQWYNYSGNYSVRCIKDINQPPAQPNYPSPPDGVQNQSLNTTLSWSCSDPENDPLIYNVYLGTSNPPVLISAGQSEAIFNPGEFLTPGAIYYWKIVAYDTLNQFTSGPIWSFTTQNDGLPIVTTEMVSNIGITSATGGGNVIEQGNSSVTARGVCWSISQNPTINDNFSSDGTGYGNFISQITGLYPSTTFYIRAFATNSEGTGYGNQLNFTTTWESCPGIPTVYYEGQTYNTVQIGDQCWFKENLNVGIQAIASNNGIIEKYCYNYEPIYCNEYGGLYGWGEMMQYNLQEGVKGICPEGWHIPANSEWAVLSDFLGGDDISGSKMKEAGILHWTSNNSNATNSSGFTGLPGGYFVSNIPAQYEYFERMQYKGIFGSSSISVKYRELWDVADSFYESYDLPYHEYNGSVRCLKNINLPPDQPTNPLPEDGAQNQLINTTLYWTCTDSENDSLTYDVYFGTSNPPSLVSSGQTTNDFNPGTLEYNTPYYWKILAYDAYGGSTNGLIWSFTTKAFQCGDSFKDDLNGQSYSTKQINAQCWMAENLNIGTMIPGGTEMSNNNQIEKYCYDNNPDNCDVYGGLYQWQEVMQYNTLTSGVQGICPSGWHIPTELEWILLLNYLGGSSIAGGKMKEAGFAHWTPPNTGATNESGFAGLPGGFWWWGYVSINSQTQWWSSTRNHYDQLKTSDNVYKFSLAYNSEAVGESSGNFPPQGNSVRCINDETAPGFPSVTTSYINNINQSSAIGGGIVADQGNSSIIERGICWSNSQYPTINDAKTVDGSGMGTFTSQLTYLDQNTTYYVRAYATNNSCTGYGNMVSFVAQNNGGGGEPCPDIPTVTYEGQVYNTVQIGNQCWFRENLNVGLRVNGPYYQTNNGQIEKACYYHDPGYCDIYGGLYCWGEMMGYSTQEGAQGICPTGWHIPTFYEWSILTDYLGGSNIAGGKMKEAGFIHWNQPNTGATNESGFSGLPGGHFDPYYFGGLGGLGDWWSSAHVDINGLELATNSSGINTIFYDPHFGYSVRCLQDMQNQPPSVPSEPQPSDGAANQPINTTLSWTCTDPENDPLVYDVSFGTSNPPSLLSSGITDATFTPGILAYSTSYYWKIVAHDNQGNNTESPVWSFTTIQQTTWQCNDPLVDDRDGQSYNTVQIGNQCWFAENLNIGIQNTNSQGQNSSNGIIEKYCYDNLSINCDVYGGIYLWDELMQNSMDTINQGICPIGWRIPTDFDWKVLEGTTDSQYGVGDPEWNGTWARGFDVGLNLKSTTGWFNNLNGLDLFGFNSLPAGDWDYNNGIFNYLQQYSCYFSASQENSTNSWGRVLIYDYNESIRGNYNKGFGTSVRCIKE